jgi:hypothetical protein
MIHVVEMRHQDCISIMYLQNSKYVYKFAICTVNSRSGRKIAFPYKQHMKNKIAEQETVFEMQIWNFFRLYEQ